MFLATKPVACRDFFFKKRFFEETFRAGTSVALPSNLSNARQYFEASSFKSKRALKSSPLPE
jgi:hypothetical protein